MKKYLITTFIILLLLTFVGCQTKTHTASNVVPMRLAVTSATQIGFLAELGQLDKVVAVCNKDLIYTPLPDSVIDLGDAVAPNLERLMGANVDAVLVCSYAGSQLETQLQRLGVRAIPVTEWQELTPLKRAEWITFFGDLLGCRPLADSIFASVTARYEQLVASRTDSLLTSVASPKSIMTGSNFRGTWYVPSGNSFMGRLFKDAGAAYPYYDVTQSGSIPLNVETCLAVFRDADVWVGSEARTLSELAALDAKHMWFKTFQTGNVYNWLAQSTPQGANNFWERGVVHPEEILEDVMTMLSDSADLTSLHFAQKLK